MPSTDDSLHQLDGKMYSNVGDPRMRSMQVTPVLGIPRGHIGRVEIIGYAIMILGQSKPASPKELRYPQKQRLQFGFREGGGFFPSHLRDSVTLPFVHQVGHHFHS